VELASGLGVGLGQPEQEQFAGLEVWFPLDSEHRAIHADGKLGGLDVQSAHAALWPGSRRWRPAITLLIRELPTPPRCLQAEAVNGDLSVVPTWLVVGVVPDIDVRHHHE